MAEHLLEAHEVRSALQGVGRKAMPQGVRASLLAYLGIFHYLSEHGLKAVWALCPCLGIVWKDVVVVIGRPVHFPIVAERLQACLGERGEPLLSSFPAPNMQQHPSCIDVIDPECEHLADAQPRTVEVEEEGELLGSGGLPEKRFQLLRCKDLGSCHRFLHVGDPLIVDVLLQRDLVQEAYGTVVLVVRGRCKIFSVCEIQQVSPKLFLRQLRGVLCFAEFQKTIALARVAGYGGLAETSQLHVLKEFSPGLWLSHLQCLL